MSELKLLDHSTNVIVMSEAGKPIFARFGTEEEISRLCGLLVALLAGGNDLGLGNIRCLKSATMTLAFMSVGSITLLAVSKVGPRGQTSTEAYLRLQLEYVYGLILSTLTDQIQTTLTHNPSYDVRTVLGGTDSLLRSILDESCMDPTPFFAGSVSSFGPLPSTVRDKTSRVLKQVGDATPNTVYAAIFAHSKLVTLVQPSYAPIQTTDLQLLRHVATRGRGHQSSSPQPAVVNTMSEMWIPICLPRIHASGFVHCYTNTISEHVVLTLVSQHGSTEQFERFRRAARDIRTQLGIKTCSPTVLEILDSNRDNRDENSTDVMWRRLEEQASGDDDYVDASGDGDRMIPYVGGGVEPFPDDSLLVHIEKSQLQEAMSDYLDIVGAHHFVFRLDVPVLRPIARSQQSVTNPWIFSQCISSPFGVPLASDESQNEVWNAYERLCLRLRLGSATVEATMDAFDMITQDHNSPPDAPGIGKQCPAACLMESPPNIQGVSYVSKGSYIYMAMNGKDFELYMTVPSTTPIQRAAALGARLARRLILEQGTLFLSNPLLWEEE